MANWASVALVFVCIPTAMAADVRRTVVPPTTKNMAQAASTTKSAEQMLLELHTEVTSLRRENMALAAKLSKLTTRMDRMAEEQNATYTVWGNNECNGIGSYKIYSGYAAGPPYGNAAGSSLCLPEVPSWAYHVDGYSAEGAVLGQVQYNLDSDFSQRAFGEDLNHNIMLCAVCHSPRQDILMIPGETICYQGWTEEYRGYLMGDASFGGTGAGYMCVDSQSISVPYNSSFPVYAMGAYLVEVRCGFLPCDDYPDGREVACVVCSR